METKTRENMGLMYGLIGALLLVVIYVLLYIGGIKVFLSGFAYLGYLILIIIAILAATKQKKLNGGYLEFKQALKITFTVFVLALFVQSLFSYFLLNYIDTNFRTVLAQAILEKTETMMKNFGVAQEKIDQTLDAQRTTNQFSLSKTSLGFAVWCIVMFIVSLIIAAIVKKSRPEFDTLPTQQPQPLA